MIGYPIARDDLEAVIEQNKKGWLKRARDRTTGFIQAKKYQEKKSIWSEVKPTYMAHQGESKCAYCERKLESVTFGKGEQDVEHLRPKGNVRSWRPSDKLEGKGISIADVPAKSHGYYKLAYDVFNYAASCKPCNSGIKGDRFPIAGAYDVAGADVRELLKEKPYLIYPIGDFDKPPEELIRFRGISPQPVAKSGHDRDRALVTIDFFRLDDQKRKNLLRERAIIIVLLHPQLEKLAEGATGSEKSDAEAIVQGCLSSKSLHTNCATSFKKLHDRDRAEAKAVFDRAVGLVAFSS